MPPSDQPHLKCLTAVTQQSISGRALKCITCILALIAMVSASAETLPGVEVVGNAADGDRKDAIGAKIVISREELLRYGETNLGDALRRVPSLSVASGQNRTLEIRLRGLGAGYTQILINGEPIPPGFSIESLSPDLVERIEVLRSPTADSSTQGIAGSVNIVLRRESRQLQRDMRATASTYAGLGSGALSGQLSDRAGNLSYSISSSLSVDRDEWPSTTTIAATDGAGAPLFSRVTQATENGHRLTVGIAPRVTWKDKDLKSLNLDGLLQIQRFDFHGEERRTVLQGLPPEFTRNELTFTNDVLQARTSADWKSSLTEQSRINLRGTISHFERDSNSLLYGFDAAPQAVLERKVDSLVRDSSASVTGKYLYDYLAAHRFAAGWEAQATRRAESRVQREERTTAVPEQNLDEKYDAVIVRGAIYLQDEWDVTSRVSAYAGLRWEALQTQTTGITLDSVEQQSSVMSPTVQVLWKGSGPDADRIRASIGRTYKAPTTRDLIPRRWVVNDNTATSPNFQGNPALKPELAWGVDVGWERNFSASGIAAVNVYVRAIENVILQRTFQTPSGTWISTPVNRGKANVAGIDFEAKVKLKEMRPSAIDLDARASLSVNASRVQQVPGPNNRLSQQVPMTATLGLDYKPSQTTAMGGSFVFEKGASYRSSDTQFGVTPYKRLVDLYSSYAFTKRTKIQLTVTNMLRADVVTLSGYEDQNLRQVQRSSEKTFSTARVTLDHRL